MANFTLKVPLDAMYVDYLIHNYNGKNNQIYVSEKSDIGKFVKHLLIRRPVDISPIEECESTHIILAIPFYRDKNVEYYNYLSSYSKKLLYRFIKREFHFDFLQYMMYLNNIGVYDVKCSIINFCEANNIHPDHYNYETLKKFYYRWRKKRYSKYK